ncbi:hypothetical protein CHS0354_029417 [Potamilus streckersoni]|uniref:Uncharacterized protein n=1 Tax=Potamilus streckersoni TaxID=2493646 RepID=A0AAE0STK0_9BIVA|nr:hypothetical protein CHS0354_029417 [Potamilus streckersoni]
MRDNSDSVRTFDWNGCTYSSPYFLIYLLHSDHALTDVAVNGILSLTVSETQWNNEYESNRINTTKSSLGTNDFVSSTWINVSLTDYIIIVMFELDTTLKSDLPMTPRKTFSSTDH